MFIDQSDLCWSKALFDGTENEVPGKTDETLASENAGPPFDNYSPEASWTTGIRSSPSFGGDYLLGK